MALRSTEWTALVGSRLVQPLSWEQPKQSHDQALELHTPVLTEDNIAHITGLKLHEMYKRVETVMTRPGIQFRAKDDNDTYFQGLFPMWLHETISKTVIMLPKSAMDKIVNFFVRFGYEVRLNEYDSVIFKPTSKYAGRSTSVVGIYQLRRRSMRENVLTEFDDAILLEAIQKDCLKLAQEAASAQDMSPNTSPHSDGPLTPRACLIHPVVTVVSVTASRSDTPRRQRRVRFAGEVRSMNGEAASTGAEALSYDHKAGPRSRD